MEVPKISKGLEGSIDEVVQKRKRKLGIDEAYS